jgi:predicted nucleic acid-binding protein
MALLQMARAEGALLISPAVFAELFAYPGATGDFIESFLTTTGLTVDYRLEERVWLEAGQRFAAYAKRRRESGGTMPRRLLADFLIGSHALVQADRLVTLDPMPYKRDFPELMLCC